MDILEAKTNLYTRRQNVHDDDEHDESPKLLVWPGDLSQQLPFDHHCPEIVTNSFISHTPTHMEADVVFHEACMQYHGKQTF